MNIRKICSKNNNFYLWLTTISLAFSYFIIASSGKFFLQDDWYHIYQTYNKSFWQVLNYFNLWQNGSLDPLNFYRPLSSKLYFFLAYQFFGLNPFYYFLFNSGLFLLNTIIFTKIAKKILDEKLALWAAFFYIFSLAHFTYFNYTTTVEDLFFGFFTLAVFLAWLEKKRTGLLFFIGALASRESALIIVPWIIFYEYFFRKTKVKKLATSLLPYCLILATYIVSRTFIYGWPKDQEVYIIKFGPHIINNLIKYCQWNLNITGLLNENNLSRQISLIGLMIICLILLTAIFKQAVEKKSFKTIFLGLSWWLIFLSPVLFFLNHRDPWNLTVASGGLAIVIGALVGNLKKRLKILFLISYLTVFFLGLNFYCQNHWTVLRSKMTKKTKESILNQCKENSVVIKAEGEDERKELQYSWYYDLGPKILCENTKINVIYKLP